MTAEQSEFSPEKGSSHFQLLATSACSLCDVAESMLVDLLGRHPELAASIAIEYVDISESEGLVDTYGVLIPVLSRVPGQTGQSSLELRWPFTQDEAHTFLAETPTTTP